MDDLLRQLGDLVLGSVPTMVIFLILVAAYTVLVHGPLRRTLDERYARTQGAVEKAQASIAAADAKAQEYEARLRAARLEIFTRRDKQVQQWNIARDKSLAQAREAAQTQVKAARASLDEQAATARTEMETTIDQLAEQILAAILPAGSADVQAAGSVR